MHFGLSAEQSALADAAHQLVQARGGLSHVRELVKRGDAFDPALWDAMAAQGWPVVMVPEADGGIGLGALELTVLADCISYNLTPTPVIATAITARLLHRAGRDRELAHIVQGGVAAVGWGDDPVLDAGHASLVLTVHADEVRLHDTGSNRPPAQPCLDPTRSACWLAPDGGEAIGGAALAEEATRLLAVAGAASIAGASRRVLEMSVEHAKTREQFGRPIGSFQAIKHRCADMYVALEGMLSATLYAAWAVDVDAEDSALAASAAKAWCSEAGPSLAASGLQIHGGIGFTWEHDLHFFLKRIEVDARQFGTSQWHRDRIVTLVTRAGAMAAGAIASTPS
jgi:alkylation response protein AidB-like acyl-CoA dehydrogenase